jgi:hypothetical protein
MFLKSQELWHLPSRAAAAAEVTRCFRLGKGDISVLGTSEGKF